MSSTTTVVRVEFRLATTEDAHLEAYDHTRLAAINTCPTWGILRYGMGKAMPTNARAMALEAGSAMHEAFAAIRLWQLSHTQKLGDHAIAAGLRIFGKDKLLDMCKTHRDANSDTSNLRSFACQALYNSGYIDDPHDKRRTLTNLEATLLQYIDQWELERYPVWVEDARDPSCLVGVEMPLNIVITFIYADGHSESIRYTGRMDGIHTDPRFNNRIIPHENKTASRLDDAWRMSFHMSHQVTGYCAGGSLITKSGCDTALVIGAQVPLPKQYSDGVVYERVSRAPHLYDAWFRWIEHTRRVELEWRGNPSDAPKYTHSCNRYFRPCSFLPFCTDDHEGKAATIAQMVDEKWDPLHEKAGD